MLSLSLKGHCRGSVAVTSAVSIVFSSAVTLATFVFIVVVACFNSWDHFFLTFFKRFQTLGVGVGVRVNVSVGLGLGYNFYVYYISTKQGWAFRNTESFWIRILNYPNPKC